MLQCGGWFDGYFEELLLRQNHMQAHLQQQSHHHHHGGHHSYTDDVHTQNYHEFYRSSADTEWRRIL